MGITSIYSYSIKISELLDFTVHSSSQLQTGLLDPITPTNRAAANVKWVEVIWLLQLQLLITSCIGTTFTL